MSDSKQMETSLEQVAASLFETYQRDASDAMPIYVRQVMTTEVVSLGPERRLADVVGLMASQSFRHVLIADEDERLHGVISDRDVLRALARTPNWNTKCVSEIMTRDPLTTTQDCLISTAIHTMIEKRINCLPVIGLDQRVCGILTSTDLLRTYERLQSSVERART